VLRQPAGRLVLGVEAHVRLAFPHPLYVIFRHPKTYNRKREIYEEDTGTLGSAHGTLVSTKLGSGTFTSAVTTTGSNASTSMFFGRASAVAAFLVAKSDGSVHGAVFMRTADRDHDSD
jgi:hypothetical protein